MLNLVASLVLVGLAGQGPPSSGLRFREGFDQTPLARSWYDCKGFPISAAEPFAGAGCAEFRWREGSTHPEGFSAARRLFEPTEAVRVRFRIRFSKNWRWSPRPYHPHLIHFLTTENGPYHGPAASRLTVYVEPHDGKLRLAAQDIQNRDAPHGLTQGPLKGGYNATLFDGLEKSFTDGHWHLVEAEFRLNSLDLERDAPRPDGIVRAWCDGKPVIDRNDVVLRSTDHPRMKFNQFLIAPYFGPGLLPQSQTLWLDELEVWDVSNFVENRNP